MDQSETEDRPIDARILAIYDSLTSSEKRLATVVMEAQASLSSFTAGELAGQANVSNATAARFFKRLGYVSYNDVRLSSRQREDWGSPLYELTGTGKKRLASGDFGLHIAQDLQNLTRTAEMLNEALLMQAAHILLQARRVKIIGFRNSMTLATYARKLLILSRPDVEVLPLAGMSLAEDMAGMGPQDALLAIGFRRRPAILREIMTFAAEAGTPTVLITDMTAVRTARLATVTLRCYNCGHSMFDSYAAPISVINYLCSLVGQESGDNTVERLAEVERLLTRFDFPVSSGTSKRQGGK